MSSQVGCSAPIEFFAIDPNAKGFGFWPWKCHSDEPARPVADSDWIAHGSVSERWVKSICYFMRAKSAELAKVESPIQLIPVNGQGHAISCNLQAEARSIVEAHCEADWLRPVHSPVTDWEFRFKFGDPHL